MFAILQLASAPLNPRPIAIGFLIIAFSLHLNTVKTDGSCTADVAVFSFTKTKCEIEPPEPAEPYRNREISRFPKLRTLGNVVAFCIVQTF